MATLRPALLVLLLGFALITLWRLELCTRPPAETTDIVRNLAYGQAFWRLGFAVYDRTPPALAGGQAWQRMWPDKTYDYPAVALLFFAGLAGLTHSLVWAKVALTALELVNALLVIRLTGSRWLGLAAYASPASLWWVSHEGQFEGVQVLAVLIALVLLRGGKGALACLALGLAIQVKLYPVVLLPLFLRPLLGWRGLVAFVLSFAPSLWALATSSYLGRWLTPGYRPSGYNAFAWEVWEPGLFAWMPGWLIGWCAVVSYGLLLLAGGLLIERLARRDLSGALELVPFTAYLVLVKSVGWGEFWYFLLVPAFALAVRRPGPRTVLFLLGLFEPRATSALVIGPVHLGQWFPMDEYLHGGLD